MIDESKCLRKCEVINNLKGGVIMVSNDIKAKALKKWIEYGMSICSVFGLPSDNFIDPIPLENIFSSGDEVKVLKFIDYVDSKIQELQKL